MCKNAQQSDNFVDDFIFMKYFAAKSARQNKGHEQEDLKEEASKPYLDQKHGWQARRSLDPEYYRNVELEVWEDSKNGELNQGVIHQQLKFSRSHNF